MPRRALAVPALLLALVLSACGSAPAPDAAPREGVVAAPGAGAEAAGSVEGGGPTGATDVVVLDVRTPAEFAEGHLAGAVNIDVQAADFAERAAAELPAGAEIVVYCRSGNRSATATALLAELGFAVTDAGGLADAAATTGLAVE